MRSYPAFDQLIHVEFRAFPGLLWLGAGFEVRIGERVFRPRNRLTIFGQPLTAFDLEHRGQRITGMVRGVGSRWLGVRQRYSLVVGLSELGRETQTMRGWLLSYLMLTVLLLLAALAIFGGAYLFLLSQGRLHPAG